MKLKYIYETFSNQLLYTGQTTRFSLTKVTLDNTSALKKGVG